ncbi:hypothetical protein SNA_15090 [Streptomyces natalensis ATCC 27448]|uniref:Secreted protein n=2 Tax=Streptomyces natalensis TaxID=68242 RepID=A0A0D7CM93_9ACTN|nr:hypothetical protein SNA_15090 [Streptomyces natalensis ATCC 27448]
MKLSAWQAAAASSIITAATVVVPLSISSANANATTSAKPIIVEGNQAGPKQESYAKCPDGTHLVGGGYQFDAWTMTNAGSPSFAIYVDRPAMNGEGWINKTVGQYNKARAYAMCNRT